MDIVEMLRELHDEKKRLDAVIASLEGHLRAKSGKGSPKVRRRGRKSMSSEERSEVSRRMTQYWENRRARAAKLQAEAAAASETSDRSSYAAGDRLV
jgi:hypothetical protein